jgi:D-glycero-alpha-D-manno-heptose-7-phosphate kinase
MNGSRVAALMLVSRTPVRVSFCGGGTDLAVFYRNHPDGGLVTSLTLDAYIYVTVNRRFDDSVRVSYSQTEIVDDFEDLQHELVREAMRMTGVTSGVEVTTIADIPARGTGLGSSSTVTVGLLHALYALEGVEVSPERLAREACEIEIEILGQTIGKQDQYAAAYGGVNQIAFNPDESVTVSPLSLHEDTLNSLASEFCLVWTGISRKATPILEIQASNTADRMEQLVAMRNQANSVANALLESEFTEIGELLGNAWELKRSLADGIANPEIDDLYEKLMNLGCTGGKLLGAGGGGFILVHTPPGVQDAIANALPNKIIPLRVSTEGSTILFDDREQ